MFISLIHPGVNGPAHSPRFLGSAGPVGQEHKDSSYHAYLIPFIILGNSFRHAYHLRFTDEILASELAHFVQLVIVIHLKPPLKGWEIFKKV